MRLTSIATCISGFPASIGRQARPVRTASVRMCQEGNSVRPSTVTTRTTVPRELPPPYSSRANTASARATCRTAHFQCGSFGHPAVVVLGRIPFRTQQVGGQRDLPASRKRQV